MTFDDTKTIPRIHGADIVVEAILGLLGVGCGAFGAHGLKSRNVSAKSIAVRRTFWSSITPGRSS